MAEEKNNMQINIRLENKNDYYEVEKLTREAFWNLYAPGCDEHYLCHIMRDHKDFVKELDYVADIDGNLVGSIMYTESLLIGEDQGEVKIVSFGPLCVQSKISKNGNWNPIN